jgi:hypothetical protein
VSDGFLTPEEVKRLTRGKVRYSAQCRALDAMGIRYIRAGAHKDGEPLVRRDALDAGGKPAQRRGHRWDRIGSVRQIRP